MINKLLEELNQKTEILNNVLSDKKYFDDLEKRIEKVNKAYIIANVERDKYKEVLDKIKEKLHNSKEYKMAIAMELNKEQSILIDIDKLLEEIE